MALFGARGARVDHRGAGRAVAAQERTAVGLEAVTQLPKKCRWLVSRICEGVYAKLAKVEMLASPGRLLGS